MKAFSGLRTPKGEPIYTQEYAQMIRDENNPHKILAQSGGQENCLASPAQFILYGGKRGSGKGQPYHAPVITPFGIRRMGDLEVGSIISSPDGGMERVIQIHELGKRTVYRLNFADGTSVECTDDHLWKVKQTNHIHKTRYINGTGQEADWRLWTMKMIMEYLDTHPKKSGKQNNNLVVPLCEPIKFTKATNRYAYVPKTDAYIIGALLGDGCITDSIKRGAYDATFSCADEETVNKFEDFGIDMSKYGQADGNKAKDYRLKDDDLREDLERLGLYGHNAFTKFIPEYYKYAPLNVRLALVQGLMDTDGTVDRDGGLSYSTVSKQLADDMAFVLRSLGAYVTVSKKHCTYTRNGERHEASDSYTLYIKIKESERLFCLSRKKERCKPYNGGVSTPTKRIVGYEVVGKYQCRCIAVDSPSSLYVTSDFTVTHNTYILLDGSIYDIENPNFRACILRNEKPDLTDIIEVSHELYGQYGDYNRSMNDMTWNFYSGAKLKFSYYEGDYEAFKKRFQGKQYSYIGLDEITHCPYKKFKYLLTDNRNAYGIRTRFSGTCNPDPDSWVATFLFDGGWVGEDGYPMPERDGLIRYCYMPGNDVHEIVWGDTREEVFELCKNEIMKHWKSAYEKYGRPEDLFIFSVAFIEGRLEDNKKLMESDPTYLARLANQDEEQQSRDLDGNWKFRSAGDDLIKMDDMIAFYENAYQNSPVSGNTIDAKQDNVLYATADVALQGGDNFVMWLWQGYHIKDVYVCRFDSKTLIEVIKAKLSEWGVEEENLAYDFQGIGQILEGHFPNAVKFINQAAPIAVEKKEEEGIKRLYKDLKSQCAVMLYKAFRDQELSIDKHLLDRTFDGHGYKNVRLRDILMRERKCIRRTRESTGKAFQLITKSDMKKIVGHSPDFFESLLFRMIFALKKKKHRKARNTWCL